MTRSIILPCIRILTPTDKAIICPGILMSKFLHCLESVLKMLHFAVTPVIVHWSVSPGNNEVVLSVTPVSVAKTHDLLLHCRLARSKAIFGDTMCGIIGWLGHKEVFGNLQL